MITELKYSKTNTYLIQGERGSLMFDTGWAGTFPMLCKALGEKGIRLGDIDYLLISHYHPDHMGIAQEIADAGVKILAAEQQRDHLHDADGVFEKEKNRDFIPIRDSEVEFTDPSRSRGVLRKLGIDGEIVHTPGHTEDSISLWLESERARFVGDLNPLYELEMHRGTAIAQSWGRLLRLSPRVVYYGHARTAVLDGRDVKALQESNDSDTYALVKRIVKLIDKGCYAEEIQQKTGADPVFIGDVTRMYLTHPNVSVQGILDRIEIKGR